METGIKGYAEVTVNENNTAAAAGSGLLDVFSTPAMIGLMEKASQESVNSYLEPGQGTVGIRLEVDHLAATPIGEKVWAETELIAIEGKVLTFKVEAFSRIEKIGEGIHKRCIIGESRFLDKMNGKYGSGKE